MTESITRYVPTFGDIDAIREVITPINDLEAEELRLCEEIENLHHRYGEIESDIADLHEEQWGIERTIEKREDRLRKVEDLLAPTIRMEAGDDYVTHWHCGSCAWESADNTDSSRFRAENHAHDTGHTVYLMTIGDVPGFDDPLADIAA